jgi:probable rRNA maturation factor
MINIMIHESYTESVQEQILEKAAMAALSHQQADPESDLSIVIEDDQQLKSLNREYRGIDAPTDVLSFASEEEADPETGHIYLGDIIISFPRAMEQSQAAGHSVTDELQLLTVHGVLHLLGHDHAEPEEKEVMWTAQKEILENLGAHILRLPE